MPASVRKQSESPRRQSPGRRRSLREPPARGRAASSKPGIGRTLVTESSLRVSVPVLSEHKTSIVAASSTAESRVGRTPSFARARAPSAVARVKVAGNATGIAARTDVSNSGMISLHGIA